MSMTSFFNDNLAQMADLAPIIYRDLCDIPECTNEATISVQRWEAPVPTDPCENFLAEYLYCDRHFVADEERDIRADRLVA